MAFQEAVVATPHLQTAFRAGIQALRAIDRTRIHCNDTRRYAGSVDVDSSLRQTYPHAHLWDYAIAYRSSQEVIYWVEVHPAHQGGVTEVITKFNWLKDWLAGEGHRLRSFPRHFIWISSGTTSFIPASPAVRRLAQLGVWSVGRILKIPMRAL